MDFHYTIVGVDANGTTTVLMTAVPWDDAMAVADALRHEGDFAEIVVRRDSVGPGGPFCVLHLTDGRPVVSEHGQ